MSNLIAPTWTSFLLVNIGLVVLGIVLVGFLMLLLKKSTPGVTVGVGILLSMPLALARLGFNVWLCYQLIAVQGMQNAGFSQWMLLIFGIMAVFSSLSSK